jgi:DNA-binding SARP family transcriptional activator
MMSVYIKLLGRVTVIDDVGVHHHLESAQARVVFARLVLARQQGATRDELADAVWPNDLPPTWAVRLRGLVSRLRSFVACFLPDVADVLVSQGGRYVLRLPQRVVVDVELAERSIGAAQDALAAGDFAMARRHGTEGTELLRASFFSDHDGTWAMSMRDRLDEFLVTGLETASQGAAALGDHTRSVLLANEATACAPLRESSHRCLMAAHSAVGNRGEALRTYQRLRRLLAEELGVDPAPETEAAYIDLLGPATSTVAGTSAGDAASRPRRRAPFVDRQTEMAILRDTWGRAVRGRRQLLYITGESGVGKTHLAKEAGQRIAADGGLVLVGRCDQNALVAYQPFVEAIDGYLAAMPDDAVSASSSDNWWRLTEALPTLRDLQPTASRPNPAALFSAVAQVVLTASRDRPMALLLDDMQWADSDTLSLFRYILHRTAQARLCVVTIARDDQPIPHALTDAVRRLEHEGEAARVPLNGLDVDAIDELIDNLLPELSAPAGDLAEVLLSQTGGNPFMVLEFLRRHDVDGGAAGAGAVPPVPRGIIDLVLTKLAGLDEPARHYLRAASLAGPTFESEIVGPAAGLDELGALDALDMALDTGFVVETASEMRARPGNAGYRFRHEVVRRVVCDQLSGARRRHLYDRMMTAASSRQ